MEHWQLPVVLALLDRVGRNEEVYCQFRGGAQPYAQCHANPPP